MAGTEITMPDGMVLAFPEGTPQEDMQRVTRDYWAKHGEGQAEQQAAPETARLSPELAASLGVGSDPEPQPQVAPGVRIPDSMTGGVQRAASAGFTEALAQVGNEDGVIFKNPQTGALAYLSPGRSISDQAVIQEMLDDRDMSAHAREDARTTLDMNPRAGAMGVASNLAAGLPFVGSWVDEAFGAVQGDDKRDRINEARELYETAHPGRATTAKIAGALTTAPVSVFGANTVLGTGGLVSKALRGGLAGLGLGASEGAIYGAGLGEEGSRVDNAKTGGLWGGGFGAGIGLAVPVAGTLARTLYDAAAGRKAREAARALNMREDVARLVGDRVRSDAPYSARKITAGGDSAILGNLGPSTRGLLDAVGNAPGEAAAITRSAADDIVDGARSRFTQTLDDVLGPVHGPRALQDEIMKGSSAARREAYDAAFSKAIDYSADSGRNIEGVLSRIEPNILRQAVDEANAEMRDLMISNQQIRATISDAGEVVFDTMPDVRQLNAIKMALDDIAESSKDSITGRLTKQGARAASQARDLRNAIGEAVPDYRAALAIGGDTIAERSAVDLGRNMLRTTVTREDFANSIARLDDAQLARVKQGLRGQIDDVLARVRRGTDFDEGEARELTAALRNLNSPEARQKVSMLLGDDAGRVFSALDEAGQAMQTRIVAGSPTAPRQQNARAIEELLPSGPMRVLETEGPAAAANSLAANIARSGGNTKAEAAAELNAYIARILTETGDTSSRASALSDFADLGERAAAGRVVSEGAGQGVAAATLPSFASATTRPEASNTQAQLRRLSELGYSPTQIVEILKGGDSAIREALEAGQ